MKSRVRTKSRGKRKAGTPAKAKKAASRKSLKPRKAVRPPRAAVSKADPLDSWIVAAAPKLGLQSGEVLDGRGPRQSAGHAGSGRHGCRFPAAGRCRAGASVSSLRRAPWTVPGLPRARSQRPSATGGRLPARLLPPCLPASSAGSALNAFTDVVEKRALARAAAIDEARTAGQSLGPLAGVPFAVKNLFDIAGLADARRLEDQPRISARRDATRR